MSKKVAVFGLHSVRALVERHPERVVEMFALRGAEK